MILYVYMYIYSRCDSIHTSPGMLINLNHLDLQQNHMSSRLILKSNLHPPQQIQLCMMHVLKVRAERL